MNLGSGLMVVLVAGWLAGCAGPGGKGVGTALILTDVPLKESGPHQVAPATSNLRRGDRVTVQRVVGDFAEIETADGRRGYIPRGVMQGE